MEPLLLEARQDAAIHACTRLVIVKLPVCVKKDYTEAKGAVELKGPMEVKEPTAVKWHTEGKLKFPKGELKNAKRPFFLYNRTSLEESLLQSFFA